MNRADRQGASHPGAGWISWILGAALLAAVVGGALHFSEERAFVRLAEQARPWWLAVAVLLQAPRFDRRFLRVAESGFEPRGRFDGHHGARHELGLEGLFGHRIHAHLPIRADADAPGDLKVLHELGGELLRGDPRRRHAPI